MSSQRAIRGAMTSRWTTRWGLTLPQNEQLEGLPVQDILSYSIRRE